MDTLKSKRLLVILIVIVILVADQIFKIWVKTHMTMGQTLPVIGNWFLIRFIENPGMAFGIDLPGKFGKPALTLFRLLAVGVIGWYLNSLIKQKVSAGLIICVAVILAGAAGNIFDSAFYGLLFSESSYSTVATLFPEEGGYAPFLYGRVVDMLYFPVIDTHYPHWFPWIGGKELVFFRPIFNIADASITTGVIVILIFQKRFFKHEEKPLP
ncbi:MAG: lipoprotein signal peptidase [Bacteroidales bacterium]|nr:lipoprotein signal peptidase [Bacteroidales bacterium]